MNDIVNIGERKENGEKNKREFERRTSLIGMVDIHAKCIKSHNVNYDLLLALDDLGIVNVFSPSMQISNALDIEKSNELIDEFSLNQAIIPPLMSISINGNSFTNNNQYKYTSFSMYNNHLYITGNFNSIELSLNDILSNLENSFELKENTHIPIKYIEERGKRYYNDFELKESKINGCDNCNNLLMTYADNGNIFIYDKHKKKEIMRIKKKNSKTAIYTAKFHTNGNSIIYGGNDGNIHFFDIRANKSEGFFNIESNTFSSSILNINRTFETNCILLTSNYILASCNNFVIKYNPTLQLCTNVLLSNGNINTIFKDRDNILLGSYNNQIIKYSLSSTSPSFISIDNKTTSVTSIASIECLGTNAYCIGGNSNVIDLLDFNNQNQKLCSIFF